MSGRALDELSSYEPDGPVERGDVTRLVRLCQVAPDPWCRTLPLHLTASALVVEAASKRYLLRWHARQRCWLQVGGHGDPGEEMPAEIALREAREETGLTDLEVIGSLVHVAIVPVAASDCEPAHEHGDLRYVLATRAPEQAGPENATSPVTWLSFGAQELLLPDVHPALPAMSAFNDSLSVLVERAEQRLRASPL